jgi:NAD(P)-dependent dehydrogenase (short-subunit alcohol dehydrogenase family)
LDLGLEGRSFRVTGASGGIGRAVAARHLAGRVLTVAGGMEGRVLR